MQWLMAFHIIFVVAWFAGLFYLPRLYVYHANSHDKISIERFKVMEHKLYWYIMTPAGILATIFGMLMFWFNWQAYMFMWMHVKLLLVFFLWCYHVFCGYLLLQFKYDHNSHSAKFYRFFNEFPTLILIAVVILVVVKP